MKYVVIITKVCFCLFSSRYGLTMFCLACDRLGVPRPVCVQNDFSMNNRVYEGDLLEAAHQVREVKCVVVVVVVAVCCALPSP